MYINPDLAAREIAAAYSAVILQKYEKLPDFLNPDELEDVSISAANIYAFVYERVFKQISSINIFDDGCSKED